MRGLTVVTHLTRISHDIGKASQSSRSPCSLFRFGISLVNIKLLSLRRNFSDMATTSVSEEKVTVDGRQYRAVREGLASILAPYRDAPAASIKDKGDSKRPYNNDEGAQAVFYNPIQQYNRDLSVLSILIYGEGRIAEKEAKHAARGKSRKKAKGKKAREATSTEQSTNVPKNTSLRKRKADELDQTGQELREDDSAKRSRVSNDVDEDEDEDLEVRQWSNNDEHAQTIEKDTNGTSSAPKAELNEPITDGTGSAEQNAKDTKQKQVTFSILDALSASGLRAVRYAKEIPFATTVIANDLSPEAVKAIEFNIDYNKLKGKVYSNVGDARVYMYGKTGNEHQNPPQGYVHKFDVIDLDPYGTAAPFFDAALQALADGGMLCVTCTDAGVFASNGYPEKAYALYGGVTMKGAYSHETGLRLILNAVATSAAKYGLAIEPLISLSIDFYARLFIRVHKKQNEVKMLAGTTMVTYNCDSGCGAWSTQLLGRNQARQDKNGDLFFKHGYAQGPSTTPLCEHCGYKTHLGGPMWAGPLHNPYFIQRILDRLPSVDTSVYHTTERIKGMLTLALEEDLTLAATNKAPTSEDNSAQPTKSAEPVVIPRLPADTIDSTPFFFIPSYVAKILHCATPPEHHLRGAIRSLGYKVTRSHCKGGSFKTNASWDVIWEVMREWVRQKSPIKEGAIGQNTPGWKIMEKMRDGERKHVVEIMDDLNYLFEKGKLDGKSDLKRALESAMFRLERGAYPARFAADEPPETDKKKDLGMLNVEFDAELGKEKPRGKLVRYQINPRANWGPMSRAG